MTTNPSPDAVEALIKILNEARCNSPRTVGNRELAQRIIDAGFTITRQPASAALVAPMTDAELEQAARHISHLDMDTMDDENECVRRIVALAKKYRG